MTPRDIISENTKLPLTLVVGLVSVVIVLVLWGKGLEARVSDHIERDDVDSRDQGLQIEKTKDLFYSIDRRLARIEGALKIETK